MEALSEPLRARDRLYQQLMHADCGREGAEALARMLASWYDGDSVLPALLGLTNGDDYRRMLSHYFPRMMWPDDPYHRSALDPDRLPERDDLIHLLLQYRAQGDEAEQWMAEIVATGCLGSDHLWRDLGLWSRDDLSELIACHFPALAEKNEHDMKWKKFLYKQLCIQEGSYTCRAPTCEVCVDYEKCFGPEE